MMNLSGELERGRIRDLFEGCGPDPGRAREYPSPGRNLKMGSSECEVKLLTTRPNTLFDNASHIP
jgi:hypothetical protein